MTERSVEYGEIARAQIVAAIEHEAARLVTMSKQLGVAWGLGQQAKHAGYLEAAGIARQAQIEPARDNHAYWAQLCTCGLWEQERTGHYPEHADWCDVPSPLDDEEGGE